MSIEQVKSGIEYGKNLGKIMSRNTDCLVIGECIPGGTTTALTVLRAFGLECNVSSSMQNNPCLLYTSPSPRDRQKSRMPSSA